MTPLKRKELLGPSHRDPATISKWVRRLGPVMRRYFRSTVDGIGHIPQEPVLFVGNHSGGLMTPDTYIFGAAVCDALGVDKVPLGLGHGVVFKMPVVNQIFAKLGTMWASHSAGERALGEGYNVLVYPGGDIDNMRPSRHRDRVIFGGRTGYIRLALRAGVPIVPVVTHGGHDVFWVIDDMRWLAKLLRADRYMRVKVWPLTVSIPWGIWLGVPPPFLPFPARITIAVDEPIRFEREGEEAAADDDYVRMCADRVEERMQMLLSELAANS